MPITLGDTSITGLGVGGLPAGTVNVNTLASNAVTTVKINNGAVSFNKLLGTDWSRSQSANGYQKLPSGLIIQWGVASQTTISFPIAFPNSIFSLQITKISYEGPGGANCPVVVNSVNTTTFSADMCWGTSPKSNGRYIAIGF